MSSSCNRIWPLKVDILRKAKSGKMLSTNVIMYAYLTTLPKRDKAAYCWMTSEYCDSLYRKLYHSFSQCLSILLRCLAKLLLQLSLGEQTEKKLRYVITPPLYPSPNCGHFEPHFPILHAFPSAPLPVYLGDLRCFPFLEPSIWVPLRVILFT